MNEHAAELRVCDLATHFREIGDTQMRDLPFYNANLEVEAWGFSSLDRDSLMGVLITPWFMSLVRLPAQALPHGGLVGRSFVRDFGSERFDFLGAHDPAIGYHETCALFSPMGGFATQALARETAREALALTRPAAAAPAAPPDPRQAMRAALEHLEAAVAALKAALDQE